MSTITKKSTKPEAAPQAPAVQQPAAETVAPPQPRTIAEVEADMKAVQEKHRQAAAAQAEQEKAELAALLAERVKIQEAEQHKAWAAEGAAKRQRTAEALAAIKANRGPDAPQTQAASAALARYDARVAPFLQNIKLARSQGRKNEEQYGAELAFLSTITREELLDGLPTQGLRAVQALNMVTGFLREVEQQNANRDSGNRAMNEHEKMLKGTLRQALFTMRPQDHERSLCQLIGTALAKGEACYGYAGINTRRAIQMLTEINEIKKATAGTVQPPRETISKLPDIHDPRIIVPADVLPSRYDTELRGF